MAAEARLSIIETWPDRQKIQKARGKSVVREGEGEEGKKMRCLAEYPFPSRSSGSRDFPRIHCAYSCVRSRAARLISISGYIVRNYTKVPKKHDSKEKTDRKKMKCRESNTSEYFCKIISVKLLLDNLKIILESYLFKHL